MTFLAEDYANVASLLRTDNEATLRASLSNNLNIILSALEVADEITRLRAELAALRAPATDAELDFEWIAQEIADDPSWVVLVSGRGLTAETTNDNRRLAVLIEDALRAIAPKLRAAALDDARLACIAIAHAHEANAECATGRDKCAELAAAATALDCVAAIRRMMEAGCC